MDNYKEQLEKDIESINAEETLEDACNFERALIKNRELRARSFLAKAPNGEVKAHLMLAVRHLEDARMRLGKAIQYSGDGVSCYVKKMPQRIEPTPLSTDSSSQKETCGHSDITKTNQEHLSVGQRIKLARKQRGVGQDAIAKELGLSNNSQVSKYERGESTLPLENAVKIIKLLNVDTQWLLTGRPSSASVQSQIVHELKSMLFWLEGVDHD